MSSQLFSLQSLARQIFINNVYSHSTKCTSICMYHTCQRITTNNVISPTSTTTTLPGSTSWLHMLTRNYAMKRKKLSFHYSGDLARRGPLTMEDPVYNFRKPLAELEEIPEVVQRLSSLSYANGQALKYHRLEEMHDRIADLFGSNANQEQRIAKLTVQIRTLLPHCFYFRKDKMVKSQLVEKIQMRRKQLKILRSQDHERFLWLLKELKIKYMPIADFHGRVTRRYKRKTTVRNKAMVVREEKLAALRTRLEAERADFETHKEKVLAQIEKDIAELDLDREYYDKLQLRRPMTKFEAAEISRRQKPASGM